MEYHDGRREIDGLRREICYGSLESEQSGWNRCNLEKYSIRRLVAKCSDAHCFPFVTLSSDGEVLTPVQSLWRRFGCGFGGIPPGRNDKNAVLLPC